MLKKPIEPRRLAGIDKDWQIFCAHPAAVAFSCALLLASLYNPMQGLAPNSFNRQIGAALFHGVDQGKRVGHFYFWYLLILPLAFLGLYVLLRRLYQKTADGEAGKAWRYASVISLAASFPIVCAYGVFFATTGESLRGFGILIYVCALLPCLLYIALVRFAAFSFDIVKWLLLTAVSLTFPALIILRTVTLLSMRHFAVTFWALLAVETGAVLLLTKAKRADEHTGAVLSALRSGTWPLAFGMSAISLFLELCNILNGRGAPVSSRLRYFLLIYAMLAIFCVPLVLRALKTKRSAPKWENLFYIGLLLSFFLVSVQPALQYTFSVDMFESANHGLAVSELLRYGKLPLIETFDAHMLSNSVWGILYGVLNADVLGGTMAVYGMYIMPINAVILYLLLRAFFDEDFSFWFVLLLPLQLPLALLNFTLLSVVLLKYALTRDRFSAYIWYWLSLVACCCYKLDYGAAYAISTVCALAVYLLAENRAACKRAGLSLAAVLGGCALIYGGTCFVRGVSPVLRMREFLQLALSNDNWGIELIGDGTQFGAFFAYILLPFTVVFLLMALVYRFFAGAQRETRIQLTMILALGGAYLYNIARILVRHTLNNPVGILLVNLVLLGVVLFIPLALGALYGKYRRAIFVAAMLPLALGLGLLRQAESYSAKNTADTFWTTLSAEQYFSTGIEAPVQRIEFSTAAHAQFDVPAQFINTVLEPDATYVDFTNQNMLYAFSEREKPVYVNQSPGLLSGEYTQRCFVAEAQQAENARYALLPTDTSLLFSAALDGIPNAYRYYIIAEYLWQNYVPLCACDNAPYTMWVKAEWYDTAAARLKGTDGLTLCDYEQAAVPALHWYSLGQVPYYWGTADDKNAAQNIRIDCLSESDGAYTLTDAFLPGEKGNYVALMLSAQEPSVCMLLLQSGESGATVQCRTAAYTDSNWVDGVNYWEQKLLFNRDDALLAALENATVLESSGARADIMEIAADEEYITVSVHTQDLSMFGAANLLTARNDGTIAAFDFDVLPGTHTYLVRASCDSTWYRQELARLAVHPGAGVTLAEIAVLEGD